MKLDAAQNKRKRMDEGAVSNGRASTHRRIARELDESFECGETLDYGDEVPKLSTIAKQSSVISHSQDMYGRRKVNYGELDDAIESETQSATDPNGSAREGKKIWWPTIGT